MSDPTPADGAQTPEPPRSRTLKVTWHPNAISGAVERATAITRSVDPDGACQVSWMDLACLVDMGRAFVADQGVSTYACVHAGADAISDLLTMLGVNPDERPEHGGPSTAETLAAAVLRAAEEARHVEH